METAALNRRRRLGRGESSGFPALAGTAPACLNEPRASPLPISRSQIPGAGNTALHPEVALK